MLLRGSCVIRSASVSSSLSATAATFAAAADSFSHGLRCLLAPLLAKSLGGRQVLHTSVVPSASVAAEKVPEGKAMEEETKTSPEQAAPVDESSEASESKGVGNLAANFMPHLFNLYGLKATAADFEMYASNATFEDPLMIAKGVKQIKSAIYSMSKVFSEAKIGEYEVQEIETSPGNGEINIENNQHYKVWGKQIDMKSLIKLQVENGKIISHQDLWDKRPLWSRETVRVPLVGRAAEALRRINMLVTHGLMGFGKDPSSKKD